MKLDGPSFCDQGVLGETKGTTERLVGAGAPRLVARSTALAAAAAAPDGHLAHAVTDRQASHSGAQPYNFPAVFVSGYVTGLPLHDAVVAGHGQVSAADPQLSTLTTTWRLPGVGGRRRSRPTVSYLHRGTRLLSRPPPEHGLVSEHDRVHGPIDDLDVYAVQGLVVDADGELVVGDGSPVGHSGQSPRRRERRRAGRSSDQ